MKTRLFLFLTIIAVQAFGQKEWTLQECIQTALKNNIQVRQAELNQRSDEINLLQSRAAVLPTLNGNISHSYNIGRRVDPFTNQFAENSVLSQNFSLSSSVILFSGLQNFNTIRQNQFLVSAGRYDTERVKNDIALNVAAGYLQVLFSQELLTVASNQAEITRGQVNRTKQLVDAGTAARGTLLEIEAQLANDEVNVANAENNLSISLLSLAQIMDLDSADGFAIQVPVLEMPAEVNLPVNAGIVYSQALTTQPQIKSGELKVKSSEKGVAVARGGMSPRFTLSGSYGTGYSGAAQTLIGVPAFTGFFPDGSITSAGDTVLAPGFSSPVYETTSFRDQIDQNLNKSFGVFVSIPIFNGLQTKSQVERAKISLQNSRLSLELEKDQLRKTIQQAWADANAALIKFRATEKAVSAMNESFKYAEQKFNVGSMSSFDYNDAKNRLVKAQSDLLQAKYDFIFKTRILDFYQGKAITL